MISFDYKPQGVCSRNIHLNLSDDGSKVLGVEFTGGCDGNLLILSGRIIFIIYNPGKSADFPGLFFHGKGREGKRHLFFTVL